MGTSISFNALQGLAEVGAGDDLAGLLAAAMPPVATNDILVVAQKIVSKAEARSVDLNTVSPSPRAQELATITGKELTSGDCNRIAAAVKAETGRGAWANRYGKVGYAA